MSHYSNKNIVKVMKGWMPHLEIIYTWLICILSYLHHISINAAGEVARKVILRECAFCLSSQAFNAFSTCIILSRFPNRTSLMLILPILTPLSNKKSKSRNSPSSLSSCMSAGNAESVTGGEDGWPLMDSARRRSPSPRPVHKIPVDSVICRDSGRWVFAHFIKESSVSMIWLL